MCSTTKVRQNYHVYQRHHSPVPYHWPFPVPGKLPYPSATSTNTYQYTGTFSGTPPHKPTQPHGQRIHDKFPSASTERHHPDHINKAIRLSSTPRPLSQPNQTPSHSLNPSSSTLSSTSHPTPNMNFPPPIISSLQPGFSSRINPAAPPLPPHEIHLIQAATSTPSLPPRVFSKQSGELPSPKFPPLQAPP